jgi:hypothetical protein
MTYQINNLDKFDEDCKKYSHSGGLNIQGTNLALHIKDFIKADRQEAYNAGRKEVLRELHDWAYKKGSELSFEDRIKGFQAVVDYTKHLINKLKQ